MLGRFLGIIVMDRVAVVMVRHMIIVRDFVLQAGARPEQQGAALHGKAMQGQAHQQQDTEKSPHVESRKIPRRL